MPRYGHLRQFNYLRGINRTFSSLELPEGYIYDASNLLPRIPGGVQAIKGDSAASGGVASATDAFPYYDAAGTFHWILRGGSAFYNNGVAINNADIGTGLPTGEALTGIPVAATGKLHSMCLYKGKVLIAEEGYDMRLLEFVGGTLTITRLINLARGGLANEYMGQICNIGDPLAANKYPAIHIPMYVTGMPLPTPTPLVSWTADTITYAPATEESIIYKLAGDPATWTEDQYNGKILEVEGMGYFTIKATHTPPFSADRMDVNAVEGQPASTTANRLCKVWDNLAFIEAYPKPASASEELDLGCTTINTDTSPLAIRVHNRSSITPIRVVDIRAKGKDFRIEEEPALPCTLPPGGSLTFKVIANPFSYGEVKGSVIVEHDFFAASALQIGVKVKSVMSAVLASPTVIDFGEWLYGAATADIRVQIKNPLKETITFSGVAGMAAPFAAAVHPDDPPADTETLAPGQTWNFKVHATPASYGTYTSTFTFNRATPANKGRMRLSKPDDHTLCDWDFDWLDFDTGHSFSGTPAGLVNYDDALLVFFESEIFALQVGGMADYRVTALTLGKGVGAMSQQSICVGNGRVWWVSKVGVMCLTGTQLECISDLVRDVFAGITDAQFSSVRACFYDSLFIATLGLDKTDYWAFSTIFQSWWRVTGATAIGAMAVKRGHSDRPAWFVSGSGGFAQKDADAAALTAFTLTTGHLAGGDPGIIKAAEMAIVETDEPDQITKAQITTDNGQVVTATRAHPALWNIGAGIGLGAGSTYMLAHDSYGRWATGELIGKSITVDGATYTITANVDAVIGGLLYHRISWAAGDLASGKHTYSITSTTNAQGVVPVDCYFRECFGGALKFYLEGAKGAANLGNLHGILLGIVPMGEPVGQSARTP